ncbi:uncharacterized protein RSE6_06445 [Rhynchosporium secalis]|uniref:Secreted protein n=1 Tax=Rhynchosporium secalis TaxID=38038 RepID=A0A1E1MAG7_RHYSE|nr:uncharacterized protein RSE6_06445 [Rhynchosporium secalis]
MIDKSIILFFFFLEVIIFMHCQSELTVTSKHPLWFACAPLPYLLRISSNSSLKEDDTLKGCFLGLAQPRLTGLRRGDGYARSLMPEPGYGREGKSRLLVRLI